MAQVVSLTQGFSAIVDDADFERVSRFKWFASRQRGRVYAVRNAPKEGGRRSPHILMHRFILGLTNEPVDVDHKDRSGLNNSRENLRVCTRSQNLANKAKKAGTASKFRGVTLRSTTAVGTRRWISSLKTEGKNHYLGTFYNELAAAAAYNASAHRRFGEFANLNQLN